MHTYIYSIYIQYINKLIKIKINKRKDKEFHWTVVVTIMWFAILHSKYIHTCIYIYLYGYIYIDIVNNYEQIQIYCILRQAFNWFIYKLDLFIHINKSKEKNKKNQKKNVTKIQKMQTNIFTQELCF